MSKGGSKTKTEYQWALAYHVFKDDKEFKDIMEEAKDVPVDRRAWGLKVKNRLQRSVGDKPPSDDSNLLFRLVVETRDIISEMGQTGAGLTSAEEVDTGLNSVVTSVWSKSESPEFRKKPATTHIMSMSSLSPGEGKDTLVLDCEGLHFQAPEPCANRSRKQQHWL